MESEVPPTLPTSGQVLGVLAKAMGLRDSRLSSKTAKRYFSGRQDSLVKESNPLGGNRGNLRRAFRTWT